MAEPILYFRLLDKATNNNTSGIQLCYENIDIPDVSPALLIFKTDSYFDFYKEAKYEDLTFGPVNSFLKTLPKEYYKFIVLTFIKIHQDILAEMKDVESYNNTLTEIGNTIAMLEQTTNLGSYMYSYTLEHIKIDDMSEMGTGSHHTKEMTFDQTEITVLTSIVLFCKLLCPIFAEIFAKGKQFSVAGLREADCASILTATFQSKYKAIILKYSGYVEKLTGKILPDDCISAYHGIVSDSLETKQKALILVKRFVIEDINSGNIAAAITSSSRNGSKSAYDNAKAKTIVQARKPPDQTNEEEGNVSRLETESKPAKHPADLPIMIKHQTEAIWNKYVVEYNLDIALIMSAYHFYKNNVVVPSELARYMLTNYFGEDFSGGQSIMYVKLDMTLKLLATLQLLLLQKGYIALAHALTMEDTCTQKEVFTDDETRLLHGWQLEPAIRACKAIFPPGFGESDWDTKLKEVIEALIKTKYNYRLAPCYRELVPYYDSTEHFSELKDTITQMALLLKVVYESGEA